MSDLVSAALVMAVKIAGAEAAAKAPAAADLRTSRREVFSWLMGSPEMVEGRLYRKKFGRARLRGAGPSSGRNSGPRTGRLPLTLSTMPRPGPELMKRAGKDIVANLALLAIYFLSAKLGLSLAFVNASATAVWPPTGIALAAVLVLGYR